MEKSLMKNKVSKYIFFVALVLLLFVDYISATSILHPYTGRVFQATVILLGIKILMTQYTKREWVLLGIGGALAAISYLHTDSYYVCLLLMLIMASKDISLRAIMIVYFSVVTCISLVVMALAASGICGDMYIEKNFREVGIEKRYCMGYTHPNSFHIIVIQLLLVVIWLLWDKLKWHHFVLFIALNMLIFCFTDSRTNVILGSVMLTALMLYKAYPHLAQKRSVYLFGIVVYVGCITLSILAALVGHTIPIMKQINELWTNRLMLAYAARLESKLTLFSGTDYQINCDMGFVNSIYSFGIVVATLVAILMLRYFISINRNRDFLGLIVFIVCVILFAGERFSSVEYITRNLLFVFMLGWGTYESNKPKEQNS